MDVIKTYDQFLKEGTFVSSNDLLRSIDAQQVLMGDIIGFNSENFYSIDELIKDKDFLKKLDRKGFKKNNIEYSKDCETFLSKTSDIKFFLIFDKNDSELDEPEYIVFQSQKGGRWSPIVTYKVNENIKKFYDDLSSKTIEIKRGDKNYIYRTSNAGNDWKLQNIQNKTNDFKDVMSNDEIKNQLNDGGTTISVIP